MLGFLCAASVSAALGETAGQLRGLLVDAHGVPVPGVAVILSGGSLGSAGRGALTDTTGAFQFAALPPGRDYQVRASFPGLATIVYSDIEIDAGQVTPLKLTMEPQSAMRERVRVRASSQVVNPASTGTETHFSSEFLDAMPILGRNYQDILILAPGVTDVNGTGNPNIHGARDTDVITLVDGVSTTDPFTGKVGAQLNIESIQEIEIKTAGASAEFSRAQGGFANIVTKSGGNDFQGTFKFYWRGSVLDGDGAGADDTRLHGGLGEVGLRDLKFNDYLPFLSFGGPFVKDRAWYFTTLEYVQKEEPVNALSRAFVRGTRETRAFGKMTWQVSPNHRLALSLNYDPQEFLNQGVSTLIPVESGFTLRQGGPVVTLKEMAILGPNGALETTVSHFAGRPDLLPNLSLDNNHNGQLYVDRNHNGFLEASERDAGEDYDKDGKFDVFEDTQIVNGKLDLVDVLMCTGENGELIFKPPMEGRCVDMPKIVTLDEDQDHDRRLTPPQGCEGANREDVDCDGHLDNIDEDPNGNGRCDPGEMCDLDHDGHFDRGTEDRNHNSILDDTSSPKSLYPYGELKPTPPDRDYSVDQNTGLVSGPFFQTYADRRGRTTLRQDLSLFLPDFHGSHDLKMGYVVERETFERQTNAHDILAPKDPGYFTGTILDQVQHPGIHISCNPYVDVCNDPGDGRIVALLPAERQFHSGADGLTAGLFLQDTYKPLPNLSLGLGLRFDREAANSSGYTFFDPAAERATYDRLIQFSGGERGLDDLIDGNGDGHISLGLQSDPMLQEGSASAQLLTDLQNSLSHNAIGHLTRHRSSIPFAVDQLARQFPNLLPGGVVDPVVLSQLGVTAQQPQKFTITNNNLSPRLSISWDPWSDGRTKVFATWGRYYDKLFLSSISGEQGPDLLSRYYVIDRKGFTARWDRQTNIPSVTPDHYIGTSLSQSPPSTTQVDRHLRTPFSDELTFGFERELAPEVAVSVRYISRQFHDQLQDIDVNHEIRIDPATGAPADRLGVLVDVPSNPPGGPTAKLPSPDGRPDLFIRDFFFNQVLRIGNYNTARYHGIETEIHKRLARRWELQASYTYSRAQGSAEDFQSKLGNDPSTLETEFGYLDFDQRHVVKLNATTFLTGDWQVGFSASWSSGLPFSVISRYFALDSANYQQFRTRYGFTVPEGHRLVFQPLARNSERNNPFYDINLRARKGIVIGHKSAAIFLEVFNLLNTDDLRILTFEPTVTKGFDATSAKPVAGILQTDATRRFGRRFQIGFQFDF